MSNIPSDNSKVKCCTDTVHSVLNSPAWEKNIWDHRHLSQQGHTKEICKVDSRQFVVWIKTSDQLLYLPVQNTRGITANTDDNRLSGYTYRGLELYFYLSSMTELDKRQLAQQKVS